MGRELSRRDDPEPDALDLTPAQCRAVVALASGKTITAAADTDGTVDDATDRDEEWVIELAIPRAALPPGRLAIDANQPGAGNVAATEMRVSVAGHPSKAREVLDGWRLSVEGARR